MPVGVPSFFIPSGSAKALLEDKYLRGGYSVVATYGERDAIQSLSKKEGMIVRVTADNTLWELKADKITWVPATFEKLSSAFKRNSNGELVLNVTVPDGDTLDGKFATFDAYGNIIPVNKPIENTDFDFDFVSTFEQALTGSY